MQNNQTIIYVAVGLALAAAVGWVLVYRPFSTRPPQDLPPLQGSATTTGSTATTTTASTTTPAEAVAPGDSDTAAPGDAPAIKAAMAAGDAKYRAGDYAGARAEWEYVSRTWPANMYSFISLAQLYEKQLKDYGKAELNYLAAIKNAPSQYSSGLYRDLFFLYANLYKQDSGNAESTLKAGIAANPRAVDLSVLLAQYYRDRGRTAEAKAQYDLAIAAARSVGDTSLVATLEAEKNAF